MGLRKWAIVALVVLLVPVMMIPVSAWKASEFRADIGDIQFGWEWILQKPSATVFHTENLATTDDEALAIAFPVDASGQTVSPSIGQTVADTASASETGFFTANWCYTALVNPGGYDLTPDISTWHPMKSSNMVGSGVCWPYMDNAPLYGESTMTFKPAINMTQDTGNASLQTPVIGPGNGSLMGANTSSNITAVPEIGNATSNASLANTTSTMPNRDYKNMTKDDIKNTSGLEKMYRNANLVNRIPQTYSGSVTRPTLIAPMKNPIDIIKPPDKPKVINDALEMTHEGVDLKTLFWDL
jgi:hypothetical protein